MLRRILLRRRRPRHLLGGGGGGGGRSCSTGSTRLAFRRLHTSISLAGRLLWCTWQWTWLSQRHHFRAPQHTTNRSRSPRVPLTQFPAQPAREPLQQSALSSEDELPRAGQASQIVAAVEAAGVGAVPTRSAKDVLGESANRPDDTGRPAHLIHLCRLRHVGRWIIVIHRYEVTTAAVAVAVQQRLGESKAVLAEFNDQRGRPLPPRFFLPWLLLLLLLWAASRAASLGRHRGDENRRASAAATTTLAAAAETANVLPPDETCNPT
jgi:hypothetical protein